MDDDLQALIDRAFTDARLYSPRSETAFDDRRLSQRSPFHVWQRLAPFQGEELPRAEQFVQVLCDNVSTGGMGFYWPQKPEFTQICVLLGLPPQVEVIVAQVLHARPDHGPRGEWLVGCRFLERINR